MKVILEQSKHFAWISIIALLIAALFAFLWGAVKTFDAVVIIVTSLGQDPLITFHLIQLVDVFLIAITLFILSASIHELFIGKLNLPDWMVAHNLDELKTKLSSVIILVMAVKFVQKLVEDKDPQELLLQGAAIAIVSGMLIAFSYFKNKI